MFLVYFFTFGLRDVWIDHTIKPRDSKEKSGVSWRSLFFQCFFVVAKGRKGTFFDFLRLVDSQRFSYTDFILVLVIIQIYMKA